MKWWLCITIAAATAAFAAAQEFKLPEGEGKEVVQRVCTACHSAERILREHLEVEEWEDLIAAMEDEGAEIEDDEYEVILNYLVKNFGPEKE
jgi:hypothetical protein